MDKIFKYSDLNNYSDKFINYLEKKLDLDVLYFLNHLLSNGEVIIFSGVIRNFFIEYKGELRDLDLVIKLPENKNIESIIKNYHYIKNSFGGFKIKIKGINIDLWEIEKTWAIKTNKIEMMLFDTYNLPNTSFFNFSSVIFILNYKQFIPTQEFIEFINSKEIDLVLKENPLPQLCIVNTFYYQKKYRLKVSKNLKEYIVDNFNNYTESDYNSIQLKHFKSIIFNYIQLKMLFNKYKIEILKSQNNFEKYYN
jgi:hypothetical protein